ncbi:MAG: hypothetical protein V3S14_00720 [Anaerolineae bacterium]
MPELRDEHHVDVNPLRVLVAGKVVERLLGMLITVVDERMRYYNTERWHSLIGYVPLSMYIKRARSKGEERVSGSLRG